jgi:HEPN domain-containing protein
MNEGTSNIDYDKIVKHWIESSTIDFNTMMTLYSAKSFGWALFLGHISTEKLLKALYVKRFKEHAPFTHNLYRLSERIGLDMTEEISDWLDEITSFNINARYDDFKKEFYQSCTPEFTQNWIDRIKTVQIWIKEML